MVTRRAVRLTLAVLLCAIPSAAWATGQYIPEIRFFSRSGQDPAGDLPYFHGRLGILRPTFDDNRLFAAYRQLTGGAISDAQAQQLLAQCCDAAGADDDPSGTWSNVRKRVPGLPPPPPERSLSTRERPDDIGALDVSCFPNAYRNAAATLVRRINEHGATDAALREWITGQDAVFANCTADATLPREVPNAPAWLKADRAYQIATTYFYRLDYDRAAALYRAIGEDADSPWRKLARYLTARAAVHAAIVAKTPDGVAAAKSAIDGIAADPELAEYRDDAPRLASMLAFGTRPQERAQELANALLAADLPVSLAADLHDLKDLERSGKRYTDVGAWIYDIDTLNGDMTEGKDQKIANAKAHALSRWHESHALPWLVAAMMFLAPDDPDTAAAVTASRAMEADAPAYYTLAWHRSRLLIGQGKADEARAELDRIIALPALPEGVGNLMRYQRLKLARDIGEFVKFALRPGEFLVHVYYDRLNAVALPLPAAILGSYKSMVGWRSEMSEKDPLYLDSDAAFAMSSFMPLPMMARLVLAPALPAHVKRDLALAVWTRAVLLEDADTAKSMADAVAPFFPQFADNWKAYRNAANAGARKVEAALLLLKLPAARPYPDYGLGFTYKRDQIGLYGPRWWTKEDTPFGGNADDSGNPILCLDCALPLPLVAPPLITEKDKASATADNARLSKLPSAPAYLGAIVMPWAKAHPGDPRVPEALHLVVRATQYGDMDSDTSKAAYQLLHSHFPRNPWTTKTPNWY